jgi:hypothetical protein
MRRPPASNVTSGFPWKPRQQPKRTCPSNMLEQIVQTLEHHFTGQQLCPVMATQTHRLSRMKIPGRNT